MTKEVYFLLKNVCLTSARNYWRLKYCLVTCKFATFLIKINAFFTKTLFMRIYESWSETCFGSAKWSPPPHLQPLELWI